MRAVPLFPGDKHYGGRGISVCARWRSSFENFLADMGCRPGKGYSVDRIDNEGDYEPGNCRWATTKQQRRNTRLTVKLTLGGITKSVVDWSEESGIPPATIKSRIAAGRTPEQAVFGQKYSWQRGLWS